MKKFTLLALSALAFTAVSSALAITPEAQQLIDFKQMVGKQKVDWLHWAGKTDKAKYDLLAKEHDEWFKFGIDNMKKFDAMTNPADKAPMMKEKLKNAVALDEKNKNEMEAFWKNVSEEARKMCDEQRAQLQKFKVNAGLAVEAPQEAMKTTPMEKMMSPMSMGK